MRFRLFVPVLLMLVMLSPFTLSSRAQTAAPTPPMGWNSWDAYGLTITEAQFRANVRVLHEKLQPFGWRYAVIDEGWYFFNPQDRDRPDTLRYAIDAHGRYAPVPARFPSAQKVAPSVASGIADAPFKLSATIEENSFKPLADWVHAQGLLFGIHIVRGIPRASVERNLPIADSSFHARDAADTSDACGWDPTNWGVKDNAAGQAWYDSLIRQYAGWGVDLLKVDCIADHPYKVSEIRQIRRAIDKVHAETGHNIVLSLSPGPTNPAHAAEVASLANMWRISDDFWDTWAGRPGDTFPQSLKGQFDRLATWSQFDLKRGQWPDADMLPFGELRPSPGWGEPRHTRLTPDEQKTVVTLWSIAQSPLILGANLTMLDPETLALLTNREVIRMDQHGERAGQIEPPVEDYDEKLPKPIPGLRVWSSHFPRGKGYAALFNTSDEPIQVTRTIADLDLVEGSNPPHAIELFDVWSGRNLGRVDRVHLRIPPHGCVLLEQIVK